MKDSFLRRGYDGDFLIYDHIPDGCPPHPKYNHRYDYDHTVPYAFKPYIMKEAMEKGYRYIGWVDSVVVLNKPYKDLIEWVNEKGYYFGNIHCWLYEWTSDKCLAYFGLDRDDILDYKQMTTACWFLDMENENARKLLERLYWCADYDGIFCDDWSNNYKQVSTDDRVKGHRHEQSTVSLLAYEYGMTDFDERTLFYPDHPRDDKDKYMFHILSNEEIQKLKMEIK